MQILLVILVLQCHCVFRVLEFTTCLLVLEFHPFLAFAVWKKGHNCRQGDFIGGAKTVTVQCFECNTEYILVQFDRSITQGFI